MKKLLVTASIILFSASAAMAAPHSYQVTGQVLDISDKSVIISKGKENWEIMRNAESKIPTSVKVGSKVTIEYTMTALEVTDKTPKSADTPTPPKKKK